MSALITDWDAFDAAIGRDAANAVLDRVCEACYGKADAAVFIATQHRHDAINYTYEGRYTHGDGRVFSFLLHDGNWNGTELERWTEEAPPAWEPPQPVRYMFVPVNPNLQQESPAKYAVYQEWTKANWFTEKLRAYHYDRHFAPGVVTEQHYRDWAAAKGLRIAMCE